MEVFTLDVGSGTQDFLLLKLQNLEHLNFCKSVKEGVKMILPSPTRIVARKIESSKDVVLYGYTMGGGICKKVVKEHAKKYKVFATEKAALSFSDDLNKVKSMGVKIISEDEVDSISANKIEMKDVNWEFFYRILEELMLKPEKIVVSVQDHGYSTDKSNRKYRFELFERKLKKGAKLFDFLYSAKDVPETYNRMLSVVESYEDFAKRENLCLDLFIIDTVFSALAGCFIEAKDYPALVMNFGNSHFVGAVVGREGEIYSMFEHHTKVIEKRGKKWIEEFVNNFIRGEISFEDVYEDGGHGAYVRESVDVKEIITTGPRVELSPYKTAYSCGDLMITGNLGMIWLVSKFVAEHNRETQ